MVKKASEKLQASSTLREVHSYIEHLQEAEAIKEERDRADESSLLLFRAERQAKMAPVANERINPRAVLPVSGCDDELVWLAPGPLQKKDGEFEIKIEASGITKQNSTLMRQIPRALRLLLAPPNSFERNAAVNRISSHQAFRIAAGILLYQYLLMRAQLPPYGSSTVEQRHEWLSALEQILNAGLPLNTEVHTITNGSSEWLSISEAMTLHCDADALRILHTRMLAVETIGEQPLRYKRDTISLGSFISKDEGRSTVPQRLAHAVRFMGQKTTLGTEIAAVWDEYILRRLHRFPQSVACDIRAEFAGRCLRLGFTQPAQDLTERLLTYPAKDSGFALRMLAEAAIESSSTALTSTLLRKEATWNTYCDQRSVYLNLRLKSGGSSGYLIHAMAGFIPISEEELLDFIETGIEANANFSAVAWPPGDSRDVVTQEGGVGAAVHAALRGYKKSAHKLLQLQTESYQTRFTEATDKLLTLASSANALAEDLSNLSFQCITSRLEELNTRCIDLRFAEAVKEECNENGSTMFHEKAVWITWLSSAWSSVSVALHRSTNKFSVDDSGATLLLQRHLAAEGETPQRKQKDIYRNTDRQGRSSSLKEERTFQFLCSFAKQYSSATAMREATHEALKDVSSQAKSLASIRHLQQTSEPSLTDTDQSSVILPGMLMFERSKEPLGHLTYTAMARKIDALSLLSESTLKVDPYDIASAYAWGMVYHAQEPAEKKKDGKQICAILRASARSGAALWGLLTASLRLRSARDVTDIVDHAMKYNINLDHLQGPKAASVLHEALHNSLAAFKATLRCVETVPAQQRFFSTRTQAGDTVYHLAARTEGKYLECLSKTKGFDPAALLDSCNASGQTPIDEACLVGAPEAVRLLWTHADLWNIDKQIEASLIAAARQRNIKALSLLSSHLGRSPRLKTLFDRAKEQLEARGFNEQRAALDLCWSSVPAAKPATSEPSPAMIVESMVPLSLQRKTAASATATTTTTSRSALQMAYDNVRLASSLTKIEAALARFVEKLADNEVNGKPEENKASICRDVIYNLEQRNFGQYFGRHFFAHRASVSDAQLRRRMEHLQNYGSSRFGVQDAVGILRVRQHVMELAQQLTRKSKGGVSGMGGLYAVHVKDLGICGSGFQWRDDEVVAFSHSPWVRVIVLLSTVNETPSIVSMYPIDADRSEQNSVSQLTPVGV